MISNTNDPISCRAADLGTIVFVDDVAKTNYVKHRSKLGALTLDTERELENNIAEAGLSLNKRKTVHLPACRGPCTHRRIAELRRVLGTEAKREAIYIGPVFGR